MLEFFFNKVSGLGLQLYQKTPTQVFPKEICEFLKTLLFWRTIFEEHFCSSKKNFKEHLRMAGSSYSSFKLDLVDLTVFSDLN